MRRVLLAGLLLLALALGAGSGYYAGDYLDTPEPTASGTAGPLGEISPSPTPSPTEPSTPVKTPIPNNEEPLEPGLDYTERSFSVQTKDGQTVRLSLEVPQGWRLTRDTKRPDQVRYVEKVEQRGVRVQADQPAEGTPADEMAQLIVDLKKSQAPENDVRVLDHTSEVITGDDGESRTVSTLVYTYIPGETLWYVIVRWIAINGENTNIEMSVTGLPQDADALKEILDKASTSVNETG
ncbi:hypothetical protein [Kribbella sindirgiensis]|uniref:DUF1795 domain-containing protein n=1 Tax=Kribbella sindirgiensis TaxID=1124744 RepID=A0A4R0JEI3_9ACTN|nr:hypothetical protein [Kribbella sindirgiensis]TCC43036.1 hypothetical protein E0H50_00665 [Kribbella sindirgiensis]